MSGRYRKAFKNLQTDKSVQNYYLSAYANGNKCHAMHFVFTYPKYISNDSDSFPSDVNIFDLKQIEEMIDDKRISQIHLRMSIPTNKFGAVFVKDKSKGIELLHHSKY